MKALVGAFNQEKALVGAFSVIVKTDCGTDGSFYSTAPPCVPMWWSVSRRRETWCIRHGGCQTPDKLIIPHHDLVLCPKCNVQHLMFMYLQSLTSCESIPWVEQPVSTQYYNTKLCTWTRSWMLIKLMADMSGEVCGVETWMMKSRHWVSHGIRRDERHSSALFCFWLRKQPNKS